MRYRSSTQRDLIAANFVASPDLVVLQAFVLYMVGISACHFHLILSFFRLSASGCTVASYTNVSISIAFESRFRVDIHTRLERQSG